MQPFQMVHPIQFKQNPLIAELACEPNWTMSDVQKRPVNAKRYLETGLVTNAKWNDGSPLVTLDELDKDKNLNAVNRAYRLKARENLVIAIDVEPVAPDAMKRDVLNFPAHYTESSTNGGVHLLIKVPKDCVTDENQYLFQDLSVFKEPVPKDETREAYYEVLFNDHFITFTKRMDTRKPCADFEHDPVAKNKLKQFLDQLVVLDRERKKQRELAKKYQIENIKAWIDNDKQMTVRQFIALEPFKNAKKQALEKHLDDFGGDDSRYEMSVASCIASHVLRIHKLAKDTISFRKIAASLSEQELIYAIYLLLKDVIPYREKHNETRQGLPWLIFVSKQAYAFIKAAREQESKK